MLSRQLANKLYKLQNTNVLKRFCHHHYSSNVKLKNDEYYDKIGKDFIFKQTIDELKFKTNSLEHELYELIEKHVYTRFFLGMYVCYNIIKDTFV